MSLIKKKKNLNKHWTNFQSKEEELYRVTSQYEDQTFQNRAENKLKQIVKQIQRNLGGFRIQHSLQEETMLYNAGLKGRQCYAKHYVLSKGTLGAVYKEK